LQREKEFLSGCVVIQRFEAWPVGQRIALRYGPQDMHYANPEIMIAERMSKGGR
jgi:hypothetical protein